MLITENYNFINYLTLWYKVLDADLNLGQDTHGFSKHFGSSWSKYILNNLYIQ